MLEVIMRENKRIIYELFQEKEMMITYQDCPRSKGVRTSECASTRENSHSGCFVAHVRG